MAKAIVFTPKILEEAGINPSVLAERIENVFIIVRGDHVPLDLLENTTLDNYYLKEGYTTIKELLLSFLSTSIDDKIKEIYALITGEKHVITTTIKHGEIVELEIGKKIN